MWTHTVDDASGGWLGDTYGTAVNSSGDLVGWGAPDAANAGQAAFIYNDTLGFKKLNDIIDPTSQWDLRVATSINDAGDIVGWGYHNGQLAGYRLHIPTLQVAMCEARGTTCGPGGDTDTICLLNDGLVDIMTPMCLSDPSA